MGRREFSYWEEDRESADNISLDGSLFNVCNVSIVEWNRSGLVWLCQKWSEDFLEDVSPITNVTICTFRSVWSRMRRNMKAWPLFLFITRVIFSFFKLIGEAGEIVESRFSFKAILLLCARRLYPPYALTRRRILFKWTIDTLVLRFRNYINDHGRSGIKYVYYIEEPRLRWKRIAATVFY